MNLAHSLHTEWLSEQLQDSENRLAEAQNTISETKNNIAYLKKMILLINSDNAKGQVENDNVNVLEERNNSMDDTSESKRTPKQMLLPEYADMSLSDAIYALGASHLCSKHKYSSS